MNKSEMARRLGCSWKTIDRRINPDKYNKSKATRAYLSILDPHKSMIATKVDNYACTAKAVYLLLKDKYDYTGSYSLVNKFVSSYKVNQQNKATIRFETIPGFQTQIDWKENLTIKDKNGNEHIINIFLMILRLF